MYITISGELQLELHTDSSPDFAIACRSMHDLYSHMGALACSLVIQPGYIRCSTHIAMTLSHWEPAFHRFFSASIPTNYGPSLLE